MRSRGCAVHYWGMTLRQCLSTQDYNWVQGIVGGSLTECWRKFTMDFQSHPGGRCSDSSRLLVGIFTFHSVMIFVVSLTYSWTGKDVWRTRCAVQRAWECKPRSVVSWFLFKSINIFLCWMKIDFNKYSVNVLLFWFVLGSGMSMEVNLSAILEVARYDLFF